VARINQPPTAGLAANAPRVARLAKKAMTGQTTARNAAGAERLDMELISGGAANARSAAGLAMRATHGTGVDALSVRRPATRIIGGPRAGKHVRYVARISTQEIQLAELR